MPQYLYIYFYIIPRDFHKNKQSNEKQQLRNEKCNKKVFPIYLDTSLSFNISN